MKHPIDTLFQAAVESDLVFKIERDHSKLIITFGEVSFQAQHQPLDTAVELFIQAQLAKKQYGYSTKELLGHARPYTS
jgi:hypothetical protein